MTDGSVAATARQMLFGFRTTHLLHVMAELGIADLLIGDARASADLAAELGAHPDALHRVLRALAQIGVLDQHPDGMFALTPIGDCFRSDRRDSLRPVARFWGSEMFQRSWGNMVHSVMTGETAFEHVFGVPVFEYLKAHPADAEIYHNGMAQNRSDATAATATSYDFAQFDTIIDVGGGTGSLLLEILQTYPQPRGVVFDLEHARLEAEAAIEASGLSDRVVFEAGDFFSAVPGGGDCYLMRQVVHDWDDAPAEAILRRCREVIPPDGRLILVEFLLPADGTPGMEAVMIDVTMLVRVGGRERTEAEYRTLLDRAGFHIARIISTPIRYVILECVPT
jgi:SAM-dependent methyltransferase